MQELKALHDEITSAHAKATVFQSVPHLPIPHGKFGVIAELTVPDTPIPDRFRILIGEITNSVRSSLNYLVGRTR